MLLDNMNAEETWKEALPALMQINKSARNINNRQSTKPMKEKETTNLYSVQKGGTKYYYVLNRRKLTRNSGEYRVIAVFVILRHNEDGRKYFLRFRLDTNEPVFQTYEFHFIKRYAERKQKMNIRWTDEDFVEVFKDFVNEGFDDPATIYLYEKNEEDLEYEFFEKSSAGLLFGQFYNWPKGAYMKYKTFVCGEQAKDFQKKYDNTIVFDAWAHKVLGNKDASRLAVVNQLDEVKKNQVRYL